MQIEIVIKRKEPGEKSYFQAFSYEGDGKLTVADFLAELNERADRRDRSGQKVRPITWEASCHEEKCGACAMVINGRPRLACGVFLKDAGKKGRVTIEPLSKFPVVRDLKVDRSSMFQMLKDMRLWLMERKEGNQEDDRRLGYEVSQCLQCGLCLEICPNFLSGHGFGGAPSLAAAYKVLSQERGGAHWKDVKEAYQRHFFAGCGKSLACASICPAHIPLAKIQARTNGMKNNEV